MLKEFSLMLNLLKANYKKLKSCFGWQSCQSYWANGLLGITQNPDTVTGLDSSEDEDDGTWCYCKTTRGGSMVGCENLSYPIKWFHMACLKMKKTAKRKVVLS